MEIQVKVTYLDGNYYITNSLQDLHEEDKWLYNQLKVAFVETGTTKIQTEDRAMELLIQT